MVALESTEDYTDYSIGFFTYHYQDGREGIRYRLVTIGEDGHLEPYSKQSSFFINESAAREYLSDHAEEIREVPYDELVHEAGKKLQVQKSEPEKEESENGKAEVPEQEETAEINEEMVETEEVDTSEVEPLMPDFEVKPEVTVQKMEPGDGIDRTGAVNFHITDDALGAGTAKQKFERNIAAIETLQQIENEHRIATQEEQQILSGYVGWGGLSEAFDEKNGAWYNEYQNLKSLLSPEEYASARESTLNAHYTSPTIIRSIYDTLGRMGFEKGNILEPSMGIGNFFGMLPERMQDSRLYGVELDSLTGRIAKQLYPKAEIQISGFEKTNHPNDFFDVVVGNVPFGQYKVADKPYDKHNFLIHDYFLAKSLDKVRPGGIVAVVTSKGTMDKKSPAVRKYLAQRAELLGAVRLPNTAFKANAGTEVTSDILFFKKRDRVVDLEPDWVHLGENEDGIAMNQYFIDHPEMVAGKMELVSGPYGMEATCSPIEGKPLEEQLKEAMSHIQGEIENSGLDELEDDTEKTTIPADPSVKNFSYAVVDGEVYYRENSVMKPVEMTGTMQERIKGMVSLRDTVNDLIAYQLEEYGDTAIREKQAELSTLYDDFTKKFGLINSQTNKRAFNQDSSYCLLCSLEVLNEDGTLKRKADMFAQKSLFVVPNHLTGQWASEFLQLYPGANILAATKKDFEPANRKKFCSRIATGDYDAVIIGHSQFEKIPLSRERQERIIEGQIDEIEMAIETAKAENGERYTIKQMEKTKKSLQTRLERLNDTSRKDDVVTFEQLGVDRLFVDESHNYKNLFLYTKMRNVAGIAQTEAQKSSDMFAKCQYMDELTGGKGVTFATGTPISNSMTELYTNMRYLQYGTLQRMGLGHFDSWAASFGETITAIELAPEGTGYRAKTRFAKFFNLPELIAVFKESADIQTPDMLKLPVPEAVYEDVVLKPSEYQQEMVESLADRAQAVRDRLVDPSQDNMLRITNDGRKLALDQRLVNPMLPDNEDSKVNACVEKALDIWKETAEQKSTQLIFCDLSTPKAVGKAKAEINGKEEDAEVFDDVYHDIKRKLMEKGVQEEEIAFIHEANTEIRKAELFAKVRSGQVRFLLGSTAKMGAGTNVQDKLIALHHLDVPWRPSDIEQQEGRILRQGNENPKVRIFRYITEGTFDAYSWQLIENKQKFIGQIMTSKSPVRSCEDVDEAALSYAEVKALATGNPYIKEKMDLDIQVSKLKLLKANHTSQIYRLEDNIAKNYPKKISAAKEMIAAYEIDLAHYKEVKPADKESFAMKLGDRIYTDKKEAGTALISFCRQVKTPNVATPIGEYLGFKMNVTFDSFYQKFTVNLKGALSHNVEIGTDVFGNLTRIGNALDAMEKELQKEKEALSNTKKQLENAKEEVKKPFAQELELNEKLERLSELNALLNMDEKGAEDSLEDQEADAPLSGKEDARTSIMEKLAQFKEQSSQMGIGNNKNKEKAASL